MNECAKLVRNLREEICNAVDRFGNFGDVHFCLDCMEAGWHGMEDHYSHHLLSNVSHEQDEIGPALMVLRFLAGRLETDGT